MRCEVTEQDGTCLKEELCFQLVLLTYLKAKFYRVSDKGLLPCDFFFFFLTFKYLHLNIN